MGYPSITEQLELQRRDREAFVRLKEKNPEAAEALARRRLTAAGIMNEEGEFTKEFIEAWSMARPDKSRP